MAPIPWENEGEVISTQKDLDISSIKNLEYLNLYSQPAEAYFETIPSGYTVCKNLETPAIKSFGKTTGLIYCIHLIKELAAQQPKMNIYDKNKNLLIPNDYIPYRQSLEFLLKTGYINIIAKARGMRVNPYGMYERVLNRDIEEWVMNYENNEDSYKIDAYLLEQQF